MPPLSSSPDRTTPATAPGREQRWRSRPVLASLLRLAVYLIPLSASVATTIIASRVVAPPTSPAGLIGWSLMTIILATAVLVIADRLMRRVLPLAALLKLSMLFPDHAPSRYAVARQVGTTRTLEERIERAAAAGQTNEPIRVAEAILELVVALSAHDRRTRGHSERVRVFTDMLAEELSLTEDSKDRLRWASLLHDIGKLVVPAKVLNKPGRPTPSEWERLHAHPEAGAAFMGPLIPWLGEWARAIPEHHERWDGTGYPARLGGEDISLAARIVAVADAFEVITAPRPYKKAMSPVAGREELARCAGTHFDPVVVRAFLNISLGRLRWAMGPISWFAQVPFHPRLTAAAKPVGTTLSQAAAVGALAVGTAVVPAIVRSSPASAANSSGAAVKTESENNDAERRGGLLGSLAVAPPAPPVRPTEPAPIASPSPSPLPEAQPSPSPTPEVVPAPGVKPPALDPPADEDLDREADAPATPPVPPAPPAPAAPPPSAPAPLTEQPAMEVGVPQQPVRGAGPTRPAPAAPPPVAPPAPPLTTPDLPHRDPRPVIIVAPPTVAPTVDTPSLTPPPLPQPPSVVRPPVVAPPVVVPPPPVPLPIATAPPVVTPPPLTPPPVNRPPVAPPPPVAPLPVTPPVSLPDPPPLHRGADPGPPPPVPSTPRASATRGDTSYVVSGVAAPLSTVHVSVDDGMRSTPAVVAQTAPSGFYWVLVDTSALAEGSLRVTAVTTDVLGRPSQPTTTTFLERPAVLETTETARTRHRTPLE